MRVEIVCHNHGCKNCNKVKTFLFHFGFLRVGGEGNASAISAVLLVVLPLIAMMKFNIQTKLFPSAGVYLLFNFVTQ